MEIREIDSIARTGLIMVFPSGLSVPQGLKPAFLLTLDGTAKAVPFPNHFLQKPSAL
jgi:hypothetical protein